MTVEAVEGEDVMSDEVKAMVGTHTLGEVDKLEAVTVYELR